MNFRRLVGSLVLAAIMAAVAAPHHHPAFSAESEAPSEQVVTRHNPYSTASHWHAIIKIIPIDPCWVCHLSRLFGLCSASPTSPAASGSGELNALPPRAAISVARFTRRSRAPPTLL